MNEEKHIDIPDYSPEELVRLELLAYPNPEGLHPIEKAWRDLAKKLVKHIKELQPPLQKMNEAAPEYRKYIWKPMNFPKQFDPNDAKPST